MDSWVELLPTIEFAINTAPNRTTGYSAFFLNYGYHPDTPISLLHQAPESANEEVQDFTQRMQRFFSQAQKNLQMAAQQLKKYSDIRCRDISYSVGDRVLLNTVNLSFKNCPKKLQRRYCGPFEIVERVGRLAYRLDLPTDWVIHPVFHVSLLRPWRVSSFVQDDDDQPGLELDINEPTWDVERLLRWRIRRVGNSPVREYLVMWSDRPLHEATWVAASDFESSDALRAAVERDHPEMDVSTQEFVETIRGRITPRGG